MGPDRRRQMVDREHPKLPIVRQCALLGVSRSTLYYRPKEASEADLSLMREMDRQHLETPFYGSRRMKAWLDRQGISVIRKRVQRLMRGMGLRGNPRQPPSIRGYRGLSPSPRIPAPESVDSDRTLCQGRREGVPLRRRNRVPPADEKGLNWEPGGVRSGAGVRSSGVSQEASGRPEAAGRGSPGGGTRRRRSPAWGKFGRSPAPFG